MCSLSGVYYHRIISHLLREKKSLSRWALSDISFHTNICFLLDYLPKAPFKKNRVAKISATSSNFSHKQTEKVCQASLQKHCRWTSQQKFCKIGRTGESGLFSTLTINIEWMLLGCLQRRRPVGVSLSRNTWRGLAPQNLTWHRLTNTGLRTKRTQQNLIWHLHNQEL